MGTWVDSSTILVICPNSDASPLTMLWVSALRLLSATCWPPWQTRFHQAQSSPSAIGCAGDGSVDATWSSR